MDRRLELLTTTAVAVVLLIVYALTLQPGPGGSGDAAKLQMIGDVLGTPHVPGYPTYVMLSWLFTRLTPFSPAVAANLLSAVLAALACAAAFLAMRELGPNQALTGGAMSHLLRSGHFRKCSTHLKVRLRFSETPEHQDLGPSHPPSALGLGLGVERVPAAVAALCLGVTPTLWSQAVMAEVYTLHLLLMAGTLLLLLRWGRSRRLRDLLAAVAVYAVSYGNHVTAICMLPGILAYVWVTDRRVLRRPALVLATLGIAVLAALQYGYLVWRTYDPGVRFLEATASSLPELVDTMLGGHHRSNLFRSSLTELLTGRLPEMLLVMLRELHLLLVPVLLGLLRRPTRSDLLLLLGAVVNLVFVALYSVPDLWVYLLPVFLIMSCYLGMGLQRVLSLLHLRGRRTAAALLVVPVLLAALGWRDADRSGGTADAAGAAALLDAAPSPCVMVSFTYHQAMLLSYLTLEGSPRAQQRVILPQPPEVASVSFGLQELRRYLCEGQRFRLPPRAQLVAPDLPVLVTGAPPQVHHALQSKGFTLQPVAEGLWRLDGGETLCGDPGSGLPLAFIVRELRSCRDDKEAIVALGQPGFDARRQAIVVGHGPALQRWPGPETNETVQLAEWQDHRAGFAVELEAPGWLVIADSVPSFWQASVDGIAVRSESIDLIFRGVFLEAGRHRVVLADTAGSFHLWHWLLGRPDTGTGPGDG